jgi:ubiquinone/menaquinone biosynthesis C-methylase UbiE
MATQTQAENKSQSQIQPPEGVGSAEASRIRGAYFRRDQSSPVEKYSVFNFGAWLSLNNAHFEFLKALKGLHYEDLWAKRILEVGCGKGHWLRQFIQWGALPENLVGVDLLADRVEVSRNLCPSAVTVICADASELPLQSESFDLVFQVATFTSIFDMKMAKSIASEMVRVLKPGGAILWYDFWAPNPQNPDSRGWRKHHIEELFPTLKISLKRITVAPPIGRAIGNVSPSLYRLVSTARVLNTHYLGVLRKPA